MRSISWSLAIALLLIPLMGATLAYLVSVQRKLGALRQDRAALEQLAAGFSDATGRAESSVGRLKLDLANLQQALASAQTVSDDLRYLLERGTALADRLEASERSLRVREPSPTSRTVARAGESPAEKGQGVPRQPRSLAERRLLDALRAEARAG